MFLLYRKFSFRVALAFAFCVPLAALAAITVEITATVPGCGDSVIGVGEQCDTTNLGGATCSTLGYASGVLSCSSVCTYVTSACSVTPVTPPSGGGGGGGYYAVPATNIVFSGKAYPRSTVTILKDAQVVATTIADAQAEFQTTISGISSGNYNFSVYSEDDRGVRSSLLSFPISVSSGVTTKIGNIFIAPTLSADKTEVRKGDDIVLFGRTTPNAEVSISVHSSVEMFFKRLADASGAYLFRINTLPLEYGAHAAKTKSARDEELSSFSQSVGFTVGIKNIASLSQPGVHQQWSKGDVNKDGRVNLVDLSIVAYWYKNASYPKHLDLNGDGHVNLVDLSILMYFWTG